jgi:phage shock protein A
MLIARAQMADVRKDMSKSLGGMESSSAFAKMDKMEQKIMKKEADADAFSELAGTENAMDDAFEKLEQDSSVDAEMARLRAELGQ